MQSLSAQLKAEKNWALRKKANGKLKQSNTPSCNPTHEMEGQVSAYQGATEVFLCIGLLQEVEVDRQSQSVGAKGKTYCGYNI